MADPRRRRPRAALRSMGYLAIDVALAAAATRRRTDLESLGAYEAAEDPWGYTTSWGRRHLELVESLLDAGGSYERGLDVGCGEGWVTERAAGRCRQLLAVDISPVALARARERCASHPNVEFREWDLLEGPSLGSFDLVLAMGVLELFRRPMQMRRARRRVLDLLAPGGHLLVTTTKQAEVVEDSRWSRLLVRGSRSIDRSLRADGLSRVASHASPTHVLTLYRAAAAG